MENKELMDKLIKTNEQLDKLFAEEVIIYFINIINDELLVNMNTRNLPFIKMKKGDLHIDIIKDKVKCLLCNDITNLEAVPYELYNDKRVRFYTFDFVSKNNSNVNKYISINSLKEIKLLKMIKNIIDMKRSS